MKRVVSLILLCVILLAGCEKKKEVPQFEQVDLVSFYDADLKKFGYKNHAGEVVISPKYTDARNFCDGRGAVSDGDGWDFINKDGILVTNMSYDQVHNYSEGIAAVNENDDMYWYFIDLDGNRAFDGSYIEAGDFKNGEARVETHTATKFIDRKGNFIRYEGPLENLRKLFDGLILFTILATILFGICQFLIFAFIAIAIIRAIRKAIARYRVKRGEIIPGETKHGMTAFVCRGKHGFYDDRGKIAVLPLYDDARHFSEELCAVRLRKYWGYIDRFGKMRIKATFDRAEDFCGGYAKVLRGGKEFYIDDRGKRVKDK